mmetsp:Transcript_16/g.39  ORF Transcript_16/g.39 Transcript_16/m.39 type:complete len:644 (-) Transcript_16:115-2046(-)
MEKVKRVSEQLELTKKQLLNRIGELEEREAALFKRLEELNARKAEIGEEFGDINANDEDIIHINAGGKIISAKRSHLTQLKGTRIEAVFSGRWDKKFLRDSNGRIFLDVNPTCFQSIVDYLNELAISSVDNSPALPSVDEEIQHILIHQFELFGLANKVFNIELPESNTIKLQYHPAVLHDWLRKDGCDGDFKLLYRSSRDGPKLFHFKCDQKGPTLTVIKTSVGLGLGGYSSTSWQSGPNYSGRHNRAQDRHHYFDSPGSFLFVLSGNDITNPFRTKIKPNIKGKAGIYCNVSHGPSFGGVDQGLDLSIQGSYVSFNVGKTYESDHRGKFSNSISGNIEEIEVFQVCRVQPKEGRLQLLQPNTTFELAENIKRTLDCKKESLDDFETDVGAFEDEVKEEFKVMSFFANTDGTPDNVVTLNVSGTKMMVTGSTLASREELSSAMKVTKFGQEHEDIRSSTKAKPIHEWTHEDVIAWMNCLKGIPDAVISIFDENQISGVELTALGKQGMIDLGVTRTATVYVLLNELKKLEDANDAKHNPEILITHSAYCFEKIIDHLRLERAHKNDLVKTEPIRPIVCYTEKERFARVVKHYFPGKESEFLLRELSSEDLEKSAKAPQFSESVQDENHPCLFPDNDYNNSDY